MKYLIALLLMLSVSPIEVVAQNATPGSGETRPYTELKQANVETVEKEIKELEDKLTKKKAELASLQPQGESMLQVGDSVNIDGLIFTITEAYKTSERNQFHDVEPDWVLAVHFTVENTTDNTEYISASDFKLYADNKLMNSYPNNNTYEDLSSGRELEGVAHFEVFGGSTLELERISHDWSSNKVGLWNIKF